VDSSDARLLPDVETKSRYIAVCDERLAFPLFAILVILIAQTWDAIENVGLKAVSSLGCSTEIMLKY